MIYERSLEENLFDLRDGLLSGRYRHGPYQPFTVFDPKKRSIHKAAVRDRVVHQAIVNVIEPIFEKGFIHDSFSCRLGKGTHAAVRRLRWFLQKTSRNNTKTIYALKCDIRKFFASVDHAILMRLISRRIADAQTLWLLGSIVQSFSSSPGKGIPLGNLTSQLFANLYLHELDWYIKHRLRISSYVRYCDDFVIVTGSRKHAFALAEEIDGFLRSRLKLELHPDKILVRTWKQGIDFLGYILLPRAIVLRTKTARRMVRRVTTGNVSSYLGLCQHAQAYELEMLVRNKTGPVCLF